MDTMPQGRVTVGVDTHADLHVAAVVDEVGRTLGTASVPTTRKGFVRLLRFAETFGPVDCFGIEGTGSYGAGLARFLAAYGHRVVEVDRPDRKARRARGKSDPVDAEAAGRAALSGRASGTPKSGDGRVEMIRALRIVKRSALKARTQAMNQIHALVGTAPEELSARLRRHRGKELVRVLCRFRCGELISPLEATKLALRELARRHQHLTSEIDRMDVELFRLVRDVASGLLALQGVGADVAGQLLVTAGDNPERLRSEAAFAHLCGVAPIPASSGKTVRHRLNRGGDRQANSALYRIVMVRMRWDERTRAYVARRTQEGRSTKEIMRCLKRFVAREVYRNLCA